MSTILTNDPVAVLATAMAASDLTLTVVSGSQFPASGKFHIRIDDEVLWVTAVSGVTWTVTRAAEVVAGAQVAAAHLSGTSVYGVLTVDALQTSLGGSVTNVAWSAAQGLSATIAGPTSSVVITPVLGNLLPTGLAATGPVSGTNLSGTNTGDQDLSGYVPTSRTVNGHALTSNVNVTASDVGAPSGSGTSTGTNTGDQTITLTGNVTGSGTGSFATTIAAGVVTTAMLASAVTLDAIATAHATAADVNINTHKLTNVVDPVGAQDAATKNYVDTQLALIAIKQECQAATVAALAASTYANGSSGVGATITLTVAAVLVLDGYTPALNDRILVKNQADATENGIYYLSRLGVALGTTAVLTRTLDFDQAADGINGAFLFVQFGTVNAATGWLCNTFGSITFGHGGTSINFVQDTGSGTYTGTSPIAVSASNVISLGIVPTTKGGLGADTSGYTSGQIPIAQGDTTYAADGRRGLYTGHGTPSAGLGFPTDYYLNLDDGSIYLKS